MVPTSKVPSENPGGGSYGRRFREGFGLRMVPTSKVPSENLGGGCAMLGGFLKVLAYEWSRHQRFQAKIREAVRSGSYGRRFREGFGLRMVPTSKVPSENLGGGCAMLGGFLKVLAYEWSRHQRFQAKIREAVRMGGGFVKVLA